MPATCAALKKWQESSSVTLECEAQLAPLIQRIDACLESLVMEMVDAAFAVLRPKVVAAIMQVSNGHTSKEEADATHVSLQASRGLIKYQTD